MYPKIHVLNVLNCWSVWSSALWRCQKWHRKSGMLLSFANFPRMVLDHSSSALHGQKPTHHIWMSGKLGQHAINELLRVVILDNPRFDEVIRQVNKFFLPVLLALITRHFINEGWNSCGCRTSHGAKTTKRWCCKGWTGIRCTLGYWRREGPTIFQSILRVPHFEIYTFPKSFCLMLKTTQKGTHSKPSSRFP